MMAGNPWTLAETRYLEAKWREMCDADIAAHVGRTAPAVMKKRQELDLWRDMQGFGRAPAWSKAEDAILRENYESMRAADLAEMLPGRTCNAIDNRRHQLGLLFTRGTLRCAHGGAASRDAAAATPDKPKGYTDEYVALCWENAPTREALMVELMHKEGVLSHA
jgi:hypothetical protein